MGCLIVLPRNRLAYRDRTVLALSPASVTKLTLLRDGKTTVLEPDRTSNTPNQWRMKSPVQGPADARAITQLLALLSDLRADEFVASDQGDGKLFGLDHPLAVVFVGDVGCRLRRSGRQRSCRHFRLGRTPADGQDCSGQAGCLLCRA